MRRSDQYKELTNKKLDEYKQIEDIFIEYKKLRTVNIIKKMFKYGKNYREIIQEKWNDRKLSRKLNKELPINNTIDKRIKI